MNHPLVNNSIFIAINTINLCIVLLKLILIIIAQGDKRDNWGFGISSSWYDTFGNNLLIH